MSSPSLGSSASPASSALPAIAQATEFLRSPFTCPRHSPGCSIEVFASIERFDNRGGHTVFLVEIRSICSLCGLAAWTVAKRYSEFEELHKELQREILALPQRAGTGKDSIFQQLPTLPGKKFLGSNLDQEFLAKRKSELDHYAMKLISTPIFRTSRSLIQFFSGPGPSHDSFERFSQDLREVRAFCQALAGKFAGLETKVKRFEFTAKATGGGAGLLSQQDFLLRDLKNLRRKVRVLEDLALLKTEGPQAAHHSSSDEDSGWSAAHLGRSHSDLSGLKPGSWGDKGFYSRVFQPEEPGKNKSPASLAVGGGLSGIPRSSSHQSPGSAGQLGDGEELLDSLAARLKKEKANSQRVAAREKRRTRRTLGDEEGPETVDTDDSLSGTAGDRIAAKHFHYHTSSNFRQNPFSAAAPPGQTNFAQSITNNRSSLARQLEEQQKGKNSSSGPGDFPRFSSTAPPVSSSPLAESLKNSFHTDFSLIENSASPSMPIPAARTSGASQAPSSSGVGLFNAPLPASAVSSSDGALASSGGSFDSRSESPSGALNGSPIASMAAISDSVANAVLAATPTSTPPQTSAALENPALANSPSNSPRHLGEDRKPRRVFNVNRLPPPNLTFASAAAAAEVAAKPTSAEATSFKVLTNNLRNGETQEEEKKTGEQRNLPTSPSGAPALSLSPSDSLFLCCSDVEITQRLHDLIAFVEPTPSSELRFSAVFEYVENLIKKILQADCLCFGSFALKTYLPDADLDISAFFSRANEDVWVQKIVAALCQEAAQSQAGAVKFPVKSVTFVNADTQVVKAQIGSISVDISANQTAAIANLALFEEIDRLVGSQHLFKRSILLAKTFFQNELDIVGSHAGFFSSYCVRTFVLFIFNAYWEEFTNPLQALYRLLAYLADFPWIECAFSIFGPVFLSEITAEQGKFSWPHSRAPLVAPAKILSYSIQNAPASSKKKESAAASEDSHKFFTPRYMNVIDPTNQQNNLGRSVSSLNAAKITAAFKEGALKVATALTQWRDRDRPASVEFSSRNFPDSFDGPSDEESFRFVTQLFDKTLQTYSGRFSFGSAFRRSRRATAQKNRSAALPILDDEGAVAVTPEEISRPSTATNSPALGPATGPLLSDSELEYSESEFISASEGEDFQQQAAMKNSGNRGTLGLSSASEPLDGNLPRLLENLQFAKQFDVPDVSEGDLVSMIFKLLTAHGSLPVGKLGSLLHNSMGNHSLPSMLKEKYGGLKKFLERHQNQFTIGEEHQFNPHIHLAAIYAMALGQATALAQATGGAPPTPAQILTQAQAITANSVKQAKQQGAQAQQNFNSGQRVGGNARSQKNSQPQQPMPQQASGHWNPSSRAATNQRPALNSSAVSAAYYADSQNSNVLLNPNAVAWNAATRPVNPNYFNLQPNHQTSAAQIAAMQQNTSNAQNLPMNHPSQLLYSAPPPVVSLHPSGHSSFSDTDFPALAMNGGNFAAPTRR